MARQYFSRDRTLLEREGEDFGGQSSTGQHQRRDRTLYEREGEDFGGQSSTGQHQRRDRTLYERGGEDFGGQSSAGQHQRRDRTLYERGGKDFGGQSSTGQHQRRDRTLHERGGEDFAGGQQDVDSFNEDQNQQQKKKYTSRQKASSRATAGSSSSKSTDNYVMVAAIDFGTTYSGYAFSFKSSPEDVRMNKNWSETMGFQSYKTPTSVLTGPDEKFLAFGYEAEQVFTEIIGDEEMADKHQMYRHFKMMLHKVENLSRDTVVESTTSKPRKAMDLFVMALQFLRQNLLDNVKRQFAFSSVDEHLIKWVITVPAIWREEAKQFMREASFKAGLIAEQESKMLVIALEPEAASLYCRRLEIDHFIGGDNGTKSANFKPNTKYMVIDAGGGTVDITVHEVLPNNQVKELHAANGGAWGGTKVDQNFIELLKRVLGEKFIDVYMQECPQQWLALMTNFEKVKKSAKPDGSSKLVIPLSWAMGHKHQEVMGTGIESVIQNSVPLGVSFANGSLIIKHNAIMDLFDPVIHEILQHIESLLRLEQVTACEYFLLVGGFGECIFLQKAIEDAFGRRVCLLVPNEAQMSVIKGAVLFGHEPSAIKSRISKNTLGIKVCQDFKKGVHDPNKLTTIDGINNCKDVFDPFVQMGMEVETGKTESLTYYPTSKDQTHIIFQVFAIEKAIPKTTLAYIDAPGMHRMGQFEVQMPDKTGGRSREIKLDVQYGGTEIHLDATDVTSGSKAKATIDFLTV